MEKPGGVFVFASFHKMSLSRKKSPKPRKSSPAGKGAKPPGKKNGEKSDPAPPADRFVEFYAILHEYIKRCHPSAPHFASEDWQGRFLLSGIRWPEDGRLDAFFFELLNHLMWGLWERAERDELMAYRLIHLLNEYAACSCKGGESFEAVAPYVLEWPVPLNPRKEYAKDRKDILAKLRNLKVASRHLLRNRKTLRGGLGDKVEHYIILLSHGFPGLPFLPALNPSNLSAYREKAWELFIKEHGERFENHPAMKSVAPEKLQGQPVSPGKRRDIIRDAWEGAWKTIARQVASQR